MEWEEALKLSNDAVLNKTKKELNDREKLILKAAWDNESYESLARRISYGASYIKRDIAPELWKLLTDVLERKITKKNFKSVMQVYSINLASDSNNALESNISKNTEFRLAQDVSDTQPITKELFSDAPDEFTLKSGLDEDLLDFLRNQIKNLSKVLIKIQDIVEETNKLPGEAEKIKNELAELEEYVKTVLEQVKQRTIPNLEAAEQLDKIIESGDLADELAARVENMFNNQS